MQGINGFVSFLGDKDVFPYLNKSLVKMSHRAWKGYSIEYNNNVMVDSMKEVKNKNISSKSIIGYCLSNSNSGELSPIHGAIYDEELSVIVSKIKSKSEPEVLAEILRQVDGDYAFAYQKENTLIFGRDPLGVKPLFMGRNDRLFGVASEAKALECIGLASQSVQPGYIYRSDLRNLTRFLIKDIPRNNYLDVSLGESSKQILNLIETSVKNRLNKKKIALGFSGGIDSSLLALIASRLTNIELISVYVEGSRDEVETKVSANSLNLNLREVRIKEDEIEDLLKRILNVIEKKSNMDLAIGLAINIMASITNTEGCEGLVLGQLADELFGGYSKYIRAYNEYDVTAVQELMRTDVLNAYSANLERDEMVASPYSNLILPYASYDLANYALSLHPNLKINPKSNERKIVLRAAALEAGLPKEIVYKPKRALQYSSNLQKIISKVRKTL